MLTVLKSRCLKVKTLLKSLGNFKEIFLKNSFEDLSSAMIRTFDTKSTKSGADCDAAPHAKMYAAR